ncbi:hypothetical protein [Lysobacter sp. Root690]|uniref:hypothetical protein n=1 Tax=Lysobacter sp. Root690 TaxID=1736588 RepID=UPI0012FAF0CE|nr:hypothetical protein [Lysobacter sp. Root690]
MSLRPERLGGAGPAGRDAVSVVTDAVVTCAPAGEVRVNDASRIVRRSIARGLSLAFALCFVVPGAQAQTANETRLRDALRDTGARLRTAEAALATQQAATASAERERDALKVQAAKPAARDDSARLAALQRQVEQNAAASEAARASAGKWQAAQQQAAQLAQQKEAERIALAKQLDAAQAQSARCATGTQALYATGRELAGLYRDPAFIAFVRARGFGPLGFNRVEKENQVRALEDKLDRQRDEIAQCAGDADARAANAAADKDVGASGGLNAGTTVDGGGMAGDRIRDTGKSGGG